MALISLLSTDDDVHTWRPIALLVAMVIKIALTPFARDLGVLNDVVSWIVILGAIAVAGYSRRALVVGLSLGLPAAVFDFLGSPDQMNAIDVVAFVFNLLLYLFVLSLMVRRVFRTERGTPEMIALAITCYLLVAHVWAMMIIALEIMAPGSFSIPASSTSPIWADLYYYSFVTMTTLGYGDVTPVHPLARSFAVLEVLCGVFFLGISIARLIGSYDPDKDKDRRQAP